MGQDGKEAVASAVQPLLWVIRNAAKTHLPAQLREELRGKDTWVIIFSSFYDFAGKMENKRDKVA